MTEETAADIHLLYARQKQEMLEQKVDSLSKALQDHMVEEEKQKAAIEKKLLIAILLASVSALDSLGDGARLLLGWL